MAKARNQHFESTNPAELKTLAEEFSYIGRDVYLDQRRGRLTVYALPLSYARKTRKQNKIKQAQSDGNGYDYPDPFEN